jgi:hypothetical protein
MHVEVTRMLAAWLADETYGVNALLPDLPRWTGLNDEDDNPIDDPLPADVTIFSEVDAPGIMTDGGLRPSKMPSLVIVVDENQRTSDIGVIGKPGHWLTAVAGIGFYAEQTEREKDIIHGNYVMRAVKQSLTLFNEPKYSGQYRKLNQYTLSKIEGVEIQRVAPAVPSSHMLGIVFADLRVLDEAPKP